MGLPVSLLSWQVARHRAVQSRPVALQQGEHRDAGAAHWLRVTISAQLRPRGP